MSIIARKNIQESIANMLDSVYNNEQSENQISDTKANMLIEYVRKKITERSRPVKTIGRITVKLLEVSVILLAHIHCLQQAFQANTAEIVYGPHRNRLLGPTISF